jgi:hypothetical protein
LGPDDRHHIKAASLLEQVVPAQEMNGRQREPSLLFRRDGVSRRAATTRLYLDKNQDISLAGHQIDLTPRRVITTRDDPQAAPAQESRRRALAAVAQEPGPEPTYDRSHQA